MVGELMARFTITALSIGAVLTGIHSFFGYDLLGAIIPQYAVWVPRGIAVLGGYTLWTMFGKR